MTALYISQLDKEALLAPGMEALLRKAVKLSLVRMKVDLQSEVSLILMGDTGIQKLNRDFRGIDQATDVLSFAIHEGEADILEGVLPGRAPEQTAAGYFRIRPWQAVKQSAAEYIELAAGQREARLGHGRGQPVKLLGDIVISTERAKEQAIAYGHSFEREMAFLTVHGMLHLLGLDHEAEIDRIHMEKRQKQILWALGLNR